MDDAGSPAGASSSHPTPPGFPRPESVPAAPPPSAEPASFPAGNDPLLTDDLATLLALFPAGTLSELVEVLRMHKSWTPFPMPAATEARRAGADEDLRVHSAEIAREILWWGSHEGKRQFGGRTAWKDIVALVAAEIPVPEKQRGADRDCVALERAILRRVSGGAADEAPSLDRAIGWANQALGLVGSGLAAPARRAAVEAAAGLLPGAGVAGAAFAAEGGAAAAGGGVAAAGGVAALVNPVGIAVAAVGAAGAAAWQAGGPAMRVLRPVVAIVAAARQSMREAHMAESFGP